MSLNFSDCVGLQTFVTARHSDTKKEIQANDSKGTEADVTFVVARGIGIKRASDWSRSYVAGNQRGSARNVYRRGSYRHARCFKL